MPAAALRGCVRASRPGCFVCHHWDRRSHEQGSVGAARRAGARHIMTVGASADSPRVIGGQPASFAAWPWQVAIVNAYESDRYLCPAQAQALRPDGAVEVTRLPVHPFPDRHRLLRRQRRSCGRHGRGGLAVRGRCRSHAGLVRCPIGQAVMFVNVAAQQRHIQEALATGPYPDDGAGPDASIALARSLPFGGRAPLRAGA